MLDSNKTISSIWIGNKLSNMELLCIHSFVAHGHDFVLYAYDDVVNVPLDAGGGGRVQLRDANELLPSKYVFPWQGKLSNLSDWFRWEIMYQKGGWHSDLDVCCLRPWDFAEDIVVSSYNTMMDANSAIMKFPVGHEFAKMMKNACTNPNKIQPWDNQKRIIRKLRRKLIFWKNPHAKQKHGESGGPEGTTLALRHFDMRDVLVLPHVFNPSCTMYWNYFIQSDPFTDALSDAIIQHSHAVHFYYSNFKALGINHQDIFPHNCLYEKLKREYLPNYDSQE